MDHQNRHLAAILFTDIVGFTAMMQKDEIKAVDIIKRHNAVLESLSVSHHGEVVNYFGDGSLCIFQSATEAVKCALEVQQQLQNELVVPLRIGLHMGEILFEDGKVIGDSVNVASRIQSLGLANTILMSGEIAGKLKNHPAFKVISLGSFEFKHVDEPIEVFALANDGLTIPKKEEMSGKLKEIQKKSSHRKWIISSFAIIVLGMFLFFFSSHFNLKKGFHGKDRSVVVLPFDNYSNDAEEINFINGINEEITTQLAKIADLKVIGRTSALIFKNSKKPLTQIAEVLDVATYLQGSVQRIGNKIRITAKLIDAVTDELIWANSYVRELKDVFSMQSEVAEEIAGQLHAKLTLDERISINKKPTENIEAYRYYLRGRSFWDLRTAVGFDSAETNYKNAQDLDPNYALAFSGLAECYYYNLKGLSQLEAIPICREYANRALLIDSLLPEAMTSMGFIQSVYDYNWEQSKITLEKAIRYKPNYPTAHLFYGNLLQYTGESTERGISEIRKALALDPLSANLNYVLGRNLYLARKYDSAYSQLKKTLAMNPKFILAKGNLVFVLLAQKKFAEAFELINGLDSSRVIKTTYYKVSTLSFAYAISGDKIHAKEELEKTLKEFPGESPYQLAQIYVSLNDYNKAFDELERAFEIRDLWMYTVKVDPTLDPIRNDPRFKSLLKKMNLG